MGLRDLVYYGYEKRLRRSLIGVPVRDTSA